MGANPTQAIAVFLFFLGFTLIAVGFGFSGFIMILLGIAVLIGSVVLFLKAKPWENQEI